MTAIQQIYYEFPNMVLVIIRDQSRINNIILQPGKKNLKWNGEETSNPTRGRDVIKISVLILLLNYPRLTQPMCFYGEIIPLAGK